MATYSKRGKTWQAKARRNGYADTATFDSKAEARTWAEAREAEFKKYRPGYAPLDKTATVADLLAWYRDNKVSAHRGKDVELARIRKLLTDPIATVRLCKLDTDHVNEYIERRINTPKSPKKPEGAKISGGTVNRELALMSGAITLATKAKEYIFPVNPFFKISVPENPHRTQRISPDAQEKLCKVLEATGGRDERNRFTEGCRNPWIRPLFEFAIESTIRRLELLNLLWDDVDFERSVVTVRLGKNGSTRLTPLTPRAMEILRTLPREDKRIFPTTAYAVRHAMENALKKLGLQHIQFRDARREGATRLATTFHLSIPEIAVITGHKDFRMLERYICPEVYPLAEKISKKPT